jgi:hypothetical protein
MGTAGQDRERHPTAEIRANKRKQTKGNESNFAFISFHFLFRIGAFQWVTADSNKKIS